jgi:hypothetical protein
MCGFTEVHCSLSVSCRSRCCCETARIGADMTCAGSNCLFRTCREIVNARHTFTPRRKLKSDASMIPPPKHEVCQITSFVECDGTLDRSEIHETQCSMGRSGKQRDSRVESSGHSQNPVNRKASILLQERLYAPNMYGCRIAEYGRFCLSLPILNCATTLIRERQASGSVFRVFPTTSSAARKA